MPRLNPAFVIGSAAAWFLVAVYFGTSHGRLDAQNHAVGRDFVNAWTAARLVVEHQAVQIFDPARFLAAERAMFDPALPFHFWSYPPTALFFVAPLALFHYFVAYALWSAVGLVFLAMAARAFLCHRRDVLLVMLSPAVATNLVLGQNGFLTAAMLLGGTAALNRRSFGAGALFGLLSFKAQLAMLLPVALLAQRRWKVLAVAGTTAVLLAGLAAVAFGWETWRAFFTLTVPMQTRMMSAGTGPFQWMCPTVFMAGRLLGVPSTIAFAMQALFAVLGASLVWRAYRRDGRPSTRASILMVATFLATPQAFNYDMIPVAAATLVLARDAQGLGDRLICGGIWIAPVAVMVFNALGVPIAPLALLVMAWRLDRLQTREAKSLSETRGGVEQGTTA